MTDSFWHVRLLGGFELRSPAGAPVALTSRKSAAILAWLALQPELRASRERLATLLWENASSAQARLNLRKALSTLRQEVRAATDAELPLDTPGDMVQLRPDAVISDVARFEQALAGGGDIAAADLYTGDLLADFAVRASPAFDHWLLVERQRLRDLAIRALCRAMDAHADAPELEAQAATRLLGLEPLDERAHRVLMRLHARQGRHAAALKQYHGLAEALERELGAAPEAETRDLFREISRGRQQSAPPVPRSAPEAAAVPDAEAPPRPGRRKMLLLGLAGTAGLGALAYGFREPLVALLPGAVDDKTIAVLPFRNFSTDEDGAPFADGLTDEVINSLVQQSALQVTGRTSSFYYKDKDVDLRTIGRELGVAWVIEGSVRRSGDRLRITAQLISVSDGFHLWSQTWDRPIGDAFAIQGEIAEQVTRELRARIDNTIRYASETGGENYRRYLTALGKLRTQRPQLVLEARDLLDVLRRAEPNDPRIHAAYVKAALTVAQRVLPVQAEEVRRSVGESVARIELLAPASAEALLAKGMLSMHLAAIGNRANELEAARVALSQAAARNPRDVEALVTYGRALMMLRSPEALSVLNRATRLDPLNIRAQISLARAMAGANQAPAAIRRLRSLAELYSDFGRVRTELGNTLLAFGRHDQAVPILRSAMSRDADPIAASLLMYLYVDLGMFAEFRATLDYARQHGIIPDEYLRSLPLLVEGQYREELAISAERMKRLGDAGELTSVFTLSAWLRDPKARTYLASMDPALFLAKPAINVNAPGNALWAAQVLRRSGDEQQARAILQAFLEAFSRPQMPEEHFLRARALGGLGDRTNALATLRQAVTNGFCNRVDLQFYLPTFGSPEFDAWRDDPAFRAIVDHAARRRLAMRRALSSPGA